MGKSQKSRTQILNNKVKLETRQKEISHTYKQIKKENSIKNQEFERKKAEIERFREMKSSKTNSYTRNR